MFLHIPYKSNAEQPTTLQLNGITILKGKCARCFVEAASLGWNE